MRKVKCFTKTTILLACTLSVLGCSSLIPEPNNYATTDTSNLEQLLALHQDVKKDDENNTSQRKKKKKKTPKKINEIRINGLKETAMTLGAQGSLANRGKQLDASLEQNHGHLDQIYNFQTLLLKGNVLPPVLTEAVRTLNKDDDNTVRMADKTYRIVKPAKFITAPPNWRNYLNLSYEKPELPNYKMLPRNDSKKEVDAWKDGINNGWVEGSRQADQIFAENLQRLQRDFNGMVLYRRLVNYKMISSPIVAETELGITGGGDEMTINDRFKRITQSSGLIADSSEWQPAVAQEFMQVAELQEQPKLPAKIVPKMQPQRDAKMEYHQDDIDPSTYVK